MEEFIIIILLVNIFPLKWRSKTNNPSPQKQTNTQSKKNKKANKHKTPGEQDKFEVIILVSHFKFVLDLG